MFITEEAADWGKRAKWFVRRVAWQRKYGWCITKAAACRLEGPSVGNMYTTSAPVQEAWSPGGGG